VKKPLKLLFFEGKSFGDDVEKCPNIKNFESYHEKLVKNHKELYELPINDILFFFDEVAKKIIDRNGVFQKKFSDDGINFLIYWFRKNFLKNAIEQSIRTDIKSLDTYINVGSKNLVHATPKGIITHWLSGNVPILGLLSLIQGVVTKNINILKISKDTGMLIPNFLEELSKIKVKNSKNKIITGKEVCKSICVVYYDKSNDFFQEYFSKISNVRVAWGGMEAVESVINTKKSYGTEDVIFGPKKSLAVIEKSKIKTKENINNLAQRIANDIVQIDQRGCNSPHNVLIEKGSQFGSKYFAKQLSYAIDNLTKKTPQRFYSSLETVNILKKRTEYDMFYESFYPDSMAWTVLYADNPILEDACFNRTIFVKTYKNTSEILDQCSHLTQSIGIEMEQRKLIDFAKKAAMKGVDRFPQLGSMTLYEVPWDGMYVMDRFLKWTKISSS
tara:strand:- start:1186 stop:2517 length:1332 start_codon:yes stop_codon:yes gene_type:complete